MSNTYTVEKKSETKTNPQHSPTIRIQVDLFEPTEERYPVFNYQKLLIEEKKRRRRDQQANFDENEESIKQLADHYEQKFGIISSVKKKKKKKTAFYNYSELAAGYDENDSFIDNTEIFDEVLPKEVETKLGGYYVNSGSLEFKEISEVTEDSDEIKSSQPRMHFINSVLEDSDEKLPTFVVSNNSGKNSCTETKTCETSNDSSSCSKEEKESPTSVCPSILSVNGKCKRRQSIDSDSANSIIPYKKKKISTVKSLIQEKKVQLPECKPSGSKETQPVFSEEVPTTENNVSSINDTIESVIYAACSKPVNVSSSPGDIKSTQNIINPPISIDIPVSNGVHNIAEELPEIIMEIIESIKTEAQIANQNNLNIFSEQINLNLLSLEYQKEILPFNAQPVYALLAECMLCDKEKLVKQVNNLVDSEEAKITEPIEKLRTAIKEVLPSVIEQYTLECNKILDQRMVNGFSNDGMKSKPGPKRPRRKFPWNEEFRAYVREIINIRTTTYSKIKRSKSIDIYIAQFINSRIKSLWPNGWMKSTNILKEIKAKEKDSRPKVPKKQPLQNSPTKLMNAIKVASKHKVSNSAMNKIHKSNKQKPSKIPDLSTETPKSTSHAPSSSQSTATKFKPFYNSPHSVAISTLSDDIHPYQATITTTAINGCNKKDPENNSVIVKTEASAGDILDLSPNKPNAMSLNKQNDVTVISNNTSQDNNSPAKTDWLSNPKHMIHQPIKHRWLQKLQNTPSPDQQRFTHISTVDQQSTKPKDDKLQTSNKLDCKKVDDKSTAKDMLSQIINESLMDNTSPLPSQFTTNSYYKTREETKSPATSTIKQDTKNEFTDWSHNDRNITSRTSSSQRSFSEELVEKETQEVIRNLLVLNQMSGSSRNTRDNMPKKHSPSVSMYSSPHSSNTLVSSPLGVIHHPAYRNTYSTTSSTMCKSRNELTHGTTIDIPKMSIGFQEDEFLKQMVKTEESNSRLTKDNNYQKQGISPYSLIKTSAQSSDNLFQQQLYSKINTKSNQDMGHNSITYSNVNK